MKYVSRLQRLLVNRYSLQTFHYCSIPSILAILILPVQIKQFVEYNCTLNYIHFGGEKCNGTMCITGMIDIFNNYCFVLMICFPLFINGNVIHALSSFIGRDRNPTESLLKSFRQSVGPFASTHQVTRERTNRFW